VFIATMFQRCCPSRSALLHVRQKVWMPIIWLFVYLAFCVGSFVVMAAIWMIVGVVVHVNVGFTFFVALCVVVFSTWQSFYISTERARMAKALIFNIFESPESKELRSKVSLTRSLFIRALESTRVAYGKLALVRVWKRVMMTMLLVTTLCVALVTMLHLFSDNSLTHSIVTSILLIGVAYIPSLTLQHDKSDFSNTKLRTALVTYLNNLPQMQSDNLAVTQLMKGLQTASLSDNVRSTNTNREVHRDDSRHGDEESLLHGASHPSYNSIVYT